jgi:hypothetical protein
VEPLIGLAVASGAGLLLALSRWGSRQKEKEWRQAAEEAGVVVDTDLRSFGFFHGLQGHVQGLPSLTVEVSGVDDGTRILVGGLTRVAGLRLSSETVTERLFGQHDPKVGDEAFDRALVIRGPAAQVHAVFDAETRACVQALFGPTIVFVAGKDRVTLKARVQLASGQLDVTTLKSLSMASASRIGGLLRMVVAVARALVAPRDGARALARNAREDPLPGVRRESLRTLASAFPAEPLTGQTLRAACDDVDDGVALAAALELGAAARPTLLRLAEASALDDIAAAAITALGEALPSEQAGPLLDDALRTRRLRKAHAAVQALAAPAHHRTAAAAEPLLLAALDAGDAGLAGMAAQVLGQVGSAAAVLPLQEAARRHDVGTRATALWAVDAIQSRLGGATPGQLSLAGGTAGEVSLADDASGGVSLAKKD